MANEEIINAMIAQWEMVYGDPWAEYEIGC